MTTLVGSSFSAFLLLLVKITSITKPKFLNYHLGLAITEILLIPAILTLFLVDSSKSKVTDQILFPIRLLIFLSILSASLTAVFMILTDGILFEVATYLFLVMSFIISALAFSIHHVASQ